MSIPIKLKRCAACGAMKPRSEFARQVSGRIYRNCGSCHTPHTQAAHPRAYYNSSEYKRASRERRAVREGREFRPGMCGRPPGYARPKVIPASVIAKREWAAWLKVAPDKWIEAYEAARLGAKREADCARARRYHAANAPKSRERVKKYKNANPAIVAKSGARRWQRASMQADGTVSAAQVSAILRSRTRCPYCLDRITAESAQLDHIIPLAALGVHGVVNLVPCCAPCNLRKSDRSFADWVAMLDGKARSSAVRLYEARYGALGQGQLL